MPQHTKRIKIRRKDLRQPDEFETLTGQAVAWADTHRPFLVGAAVVVLVLAVVTLAMARWRSSRAEAAAAEFRVAQATLQADKPTDAAKAFAVLAETYPRTPYGRLATLYRGHALARAGDAAGAATAYGEYLASSPDVGYLRQEALVGLGHAREGTGDAAGALDAYTQAAGLAGPFRADASLAEARLEEAAGHADKAKDIYERLVKESLDPDTKAFLVSKLPPGSVPADTAAVGSAVVEVR
jgi:hypothetical protein